MKALDEVFRVYYHVVKSGIRWMEIESGPKALPSTYRQMERGVRVKDKAVDV